MLVLTFQVGSDRLALDVRRIREIVPCVRLQPVACRPPWLAGIFIYRGHVVPVIDLHRLLGVGECPVHLSTRIILVLHTFDHQERLVGLLAAKVADVREMRDLRSLATSATLAPFVADVARLPHAAAPADFRIQPASATPTNVAPQSELGNEPIRPDLGLVLVDGQEILHLVELERLLPDSYNGKLALITRESPA